jgi:hypothetical protein
MFKDKRLCLSNSSEKLSFFKVSLSMQQYTAIDV